MTADGTAGGVSVPLFDAKFEHARLEAVMALEQSQAAKDHGLLKILELARRVFSAPVAMVLLVEANRLSVLMQCGEEVSLDDTPRDESEFDIHSHHPEIVFVKDKRTERGSGPGQSGVGAPLEIADGVPVGFFCLFGENLNSLTSDQIEQLKGFADLAADRLNACLEAEQSKVRRLADLQAKPDQTSVHMQSLLDVTDCGLLVFEPIFDDAQAIVDFEIVVANAANELYNGRSPEMLMGNTVKDVFGDIVPESEFQKLVQVATDRKPQELDLEYSFSGVTGVFQVRLLPVSEGGVTMYWHDASAERRYEKASQLLQSLSLSADEPDEVFLRSLITTGKKLLDMQTAVFSVSEPGGFRIMYLDGCAPGWSEGDLLPSDKSPQVILGKGAEPLCFHDLRLVKDAKKLLKRFHSGSYVSVPVMMDGEREACLSFYSRSARILPYSSMEMSFVALLAQLAAQRMQLTDAKRALQRSHEEMKLIFDNVPLAIFRKDAHNRVLNLNPAARRIIGVDETVEAPIDLAEKLPDSAEDIHRVDRWAFDKGAPLRNLTLKDPYAGESWLNVDVIPFNLSSDTPDNLLVVIGDVTRRVEAEERLRSTIEALENANNYLEQYNAIVSHDLKAPLRHIRMLSDLLIKTIGDDHDGSDYAKLIHESTEKAQRLIDSLLNLSRVSRVSLSPEDVPFKSLVEQVESVMSADLAKAGAVIHCNNKAHVRCDPALMNQLLQNLIENALKYRSENTPYIVFDSNEENGVTIHSVSDNGVGIEPQYADAVFDVFRRLADGVERGDGEGIGLAICRRIVERHGGKIWLDKDYRRGARFKFTLGEMGASQVPTNLDTPPELNTPTPS